MPTDAWTTVLIAALLLNALLGFGYRVYRLARGGPIGDVIGQGILALLLAGLSLAISTEAGWARWAALAYALFFGLVVMPVWMLAVLIPMRPQATDYVFTVLYWITLALIALAAVLL